jgi:hypothetical protein
MANRTRTVEDAGVKRNFTFNKDGTQYRVFETNPKRTQDVFRFELWKEGSSKPYVVSFQDQAGQSSGCSCPAGLYHRAKGECKHVKMCRSEFLTATSRPAPRQAAPASKALPAPVARQAQLSLVGMDESKTLTDKIAALRDQYATKRTEMLAAQDVLAKLTDELADIERSGKLARERLNLLRSRAA